MHKVAFDALKTRFEGINEKVLDRIAKNIAKTATTAEEVKDSVEAITIQQIIDAEGDRRATDAQKTAVANYERKHGLKDGKTIEPSDPNEPKDTPDAKDPDGMPQWAKTLVENNAKLQQQLAAMSTERITNDRKRQLSAVVEQLPEHLQKPYARMKLDGLSDEEFKTTLEDVKTEVGGSSTISSKADLSLPVLWAEKSRTLKNSPRRSWNRSPTGTAHRRKTLNRSNKNTPLTEHTKN